MCVSSVVLYFILFVLSLSLSLALSMYVPYSVSVAEKKNTTDKEH